MSTDAQLALLAARQYGVVTARQLALSKAAVTRRVRSGRLHVVHRGVYAVGHPASLPIADGSPRPTAPFTAASRSPHRRGATGDRVLDRRPVEQLQELRFADRLTKLVVGDDVRDVGEGASARLRAHLPALVTQSEMEDRLLLICRRHRLPLPERQHRIGARRYDFVWPAERLVVETDGWRAHGGAYSFQADRSTTNALQLAGWLVLRFTWDDLTRRVRNVAAAVRAALGPERPQS